MDKQKIIPQIKFHSEAHEAVNFYLRCFPKSKLTDILRLGDNEIINFELGGYKFIAINDGNEIKRNSSISFIVNFDPYRDKDAEYKLRGLWASLSENGRELMSLNRYSYSDLFGKIIDKYGILWQLMLLPKMDERQPFIVMALNFTDDKSTKAEDAVNLYTSIFNNSKLGNINKYQTNSKDNLKDGVQFVDFSLDGQCFVAQDGYDYENKFNEGVSLLINCRDQIELDYLWNKLKFGENINTRGRLKDRFGLHWQIVPVELYKCLVKSSNNDIDIFNDRLKKMKKIDYRNLFIDYE